MSMTSLDALLEYFTLTELEDILMRSNGGYLHEYSQLDGHEPALLPEHVRSNIHEVQKWEAINILCFRTERGSHEEMWQQGGTNLPEKLRVRMVLGWFEIHTLTRVCNALGIVKGTREEMAERLASNVHAIRRNNMGWIFRMQNVGKGRSPLRPPVRLEKRLGFTLAFAGLGFMVGWWLSYGVALLLGVITGGDWLESNLRLAITSVFIVVLAVCGYLRSME